MRLTVLLSGDSLEPEETLVHVDGHVRLPDESKHELVGETRMRRLQFVESRTQCVRSGRIALFKLKHVNAYT